MVKKLKKQLNAQELVIKYIAEKFVKGNLGRNVRFSVSALDYKLFFFIRILCFRPPWHTRTELSFTRKIIPKYSHIKLARPWLLFLVQTPN